MILLLAALLAAPAPSPAAELYKTHCQSCHMADGNSPLEPLNFADGKWKHGSDPAKLAVVISDGVAGSAMLPFKAKLSPAEIRSLAEYVRGFDKKLAGGGKAKKK
jgi:mono/diheme cytochrome c family protein